MDIASTLIDSRVLTGAIKWNRNEIDVRVHTDHLTRLGESGVAWAHRALDPASPLLYVVSNGFTDRFRQAVAASRDEVYLWSLGDLYQSM